MTKDEALKLALKFIERVNKDGWILADFEPEMYATITAIKEALAQPQRTWVGLTDEEIDAVTDSQWAKGVNKPIYAAHRAYARAIEAKLKERNT